MGAGAAVVQLGGTDIGPMVCARANTAETGVAATGAASCAATAVDAAAAAADGAAAASGKSCWANRVPNWKIPAPK
ncbi:hypothetical protein I551_1438 [Mycobacterium ulcerans str. Harvey]|uniref:Uncharacterized protein n=1 Tax=Mycobacterium ulcerans str. Harvey TaxID=1299332 RepID=A0ABN0R4K2_MYCUL|nr:hypothetical protein I551_1438 [Mycobacterium ulcerans str. Harvey]